MTADKHSRTAASGGSPRNEGEGAPGSKSAPTTVPLAANGQNIVTPDPWHTFSHLTEARIALGRAGSSLPTSPLLHFAADHAMARDAIHTAFDTNSLAQTLADLNLASLLAHSQAASRDEYLRRPDLGRSLNAPSRLALMPTEPVPTNRLTIILADGLSPLAPMRHAISLIQHLRPGLQSWSLDAIVLATQARVALADEIGDIRAAEATLILIGERPGLKSHDSLGAYLTYHPQPGRTDAERNCVSNIRGGGLAPADAAARLIRLLANARDLRASGVCLKEEPSPARFPQPPAPRLSELSE